MDGRSKSTGRLPAASPESMSGPWTPPATPAPDRSCSLEAEAAAIAPPSLVFSRGAKATSPRRQTEQELALRQSGSRSVLREFLRGERDSHRSTVTRSTLLGEFWKRVW